MYKFLKSLLVVVFIVGLIVYVTFFSDTIRSHIIQFTHGKQILGVSIKNVSDQKFSSDIAKEASRSAESAKQQLLQIKIGDIIHSLTVGQKFVKDLSGLQQSFEQELKKLAK